MPRTVTIKSLPEAFAVIKEMQGQDYEWGEDYRAAGRAALAEILEGQMALRVDRHLEEMAARGTAERRNGAYSRWLLSELGRIELSVPVRPSPAHRYFRPRGGRRLHLFPWHAGQVLTFRTRAWLSFAPPTCRMP